MTGFEEWFEKNGFGKDMWKDFRECHKQILRLEKDKKNEEMTLLGLTRRLNEHPEEWDGPCECETCLSYAENDGE